jgi:RNA polymerase sigma factor (sigma-70 family)
MLKIAPKPGDPATSHDDLFMARYERLVRSALRLTEGQQQAAEDLVHDAFIQFTLKQPNLAAIESLDDYLFVMLRNLHISQARRASQTPTIRLVISDYDTAQMSLRLVDPQRRLQARDDLRRVCEYAAERKETSKAASVLILRFFHLYFPAEIAKVLCTTRQAVEVWLINARRESHLCLEDPSALKLIGGRKANAGKILQVPQRDHAHRSTNILRELRETIFASRLGDCLDANQFRELYAAEKTIARERLAHIVSCPSCLELVNELLGLSPLSERYQMESTDSDVPPSTGGGPPSTPGGNRGVGEAGERLRRRRRDTIEHRPKELRIAVNGFFVGRQKVGLSINELALKLNVEEKISFIEVFSEQGLLLSHFTVTPPTDGEIEQHDEVELGEGRVLETAVSFDTQWPTLKVVYRDPLVAHLQNVLVEGEVDVNHDAFEARDRDSLIGDAAPDRIAAEPQRLLPDRSWNLSALRAQFRRLFAPQFWLRPSAITAVFALVLLATVLIVMRRPQPEAPVTAATLLQRATSAEESASANTSTTTHRTLQIEERRGSIDGDVLTRQRVEVWQSAAKNLTARRLYDERGRLLAGEWTRTDGVTTVYNHGARPQLKPAGPITVPLSLENVWQVSPSAKEYAALVGQVENIRLEKRANHYILSFDAGSGAAPQKLLQARLVLSRDDLHAVEQTLLVRQENGQRAYRIVETSFERRPNDAVAPAVFEPEPELFSERMKDEGGRMKENPNAALPLPLGPSPVVATPALEVEVLHLLNQANAFMGEQVTVTRTSEGRLLVSGLVETEERKSELLRALATVRSNPAVRVEVETVAAAAQRERPKSPSNVTVERVETTEGTSPAYAELKKKFSDDEARRFADRVMARSRQARRHALALKQLAERFSLNDLHTLPEADRARWIGLLQAHSRDFQREVGGLRRELQQVFPALSEPPAVAGGLSGDAEIQETVRRLYEFSVTCDEAVRQSFSVSAQNSGGPQVKIQQFWNSLKSAEELAARIQTAR